MSPVRLAWEHFRIVAMNELQYRANLIIQILNSIITVATGLVAITLVFSHTEDLGGWTRPQLLIVMGIHIALGGVMGALVEPNMRRLMEDIEQGNFDFVLVKPSDAQLMVSIRSFRVWQLVDVLIGGVIVAYATTDLPGAVGPGRTLAFVLAALMGVMVMYCIWLVITTFAFRIVRADSIIDLFQGVYQAGRWPVSIYPSWLRGTLTFVVPLALAVTVPAETISARLGPGFLLVGLGVTAGLMTVTRLIWRWNLRRYSGATA